MANDLFGGLGGLMKGLTSFMPQDDPNVKLINAQSEIGDMQKKRDEIYIKAGKRAIAENPSAFNAEMSELKSIEAKIAECQALLNKAEDEKKAAEMKKKEEEDARTCPECGMVNPEGTKFCQECGAKLGVVSSVTCPSCGAKLQPGVRFCGECGARLG